MTLMGIHVVSFLLGLVIGYLARSGFFRGLAGNGG